MYFRKEFSDLTHSGVSVAHWQHTEFQFQGTMVQFQGGEHFSSFVFEFGSHDCRLPLN